MSFNISMSTSCEDEDCGSHRSFSMNDNGDHINDYLRAFRDAMRAMGFDYVNEIKAVCGVDDYKCEHSSLNDAQMALDI